VGLAACEFPTSVPQWDQTWEVPGERVSVSVAELLPADIRITPDSSAFETDAPGTSISFSLADMCGSVCTVANGLTVPKPEFRDTITTTSALPGDLVSTTLTGGSLNATIAHNLSFDPLRPSTDPANPRGFLVVDVTSNGNVVAHDSIDGNDTSFPSGSSLSPSLDIQPVEVSGSLDIRIIIYSPSGDPATIDTADTLGVNVATATLQFSEATINASSVTIDPVTTPIDFPELESDNALLDHIQSGSLLLDVSNPFSVTGNLDIAFQGSTTPVQRTLAINTGTYADSVSFTGTELRSLLSSGAVDLVASGSVSASGGAITVTPTQELVLDSRFRLVMLIGSSEDM
jgi:hypothetical protein